MSNEEDRESKPNELRCMVGGIHVDEQYAKVMWPLVSKNPISYEEYQTLVAERGNDDPHQPSSMSWPELFHRHGLAELLMKRGGFDVNEVWVVLYGHFGDRSDVERRVAMWLKGELRKLPKGKDAAGASPVRRRGLLSPLQIADIAIALLDYDYDMGDKPPPTPELIDLLGELLGVTRHRAWFANTHESNEKFSLAAQIDAVAALRGATLPVARLAKLTGMSTGTISTWRRSPRYKELVEFEKRKPFLGPPIPPSALEPK